MPILSSELFRKVRQIQIRTGHAVSDLFAGQYHSVFKGQGIEFHEVREYVPGDDIRAIDWNVTARAGHPFVKQFIEERELTVMLLVDISGSNEFGGAGPLKRDLIAEMAAVLAFSAIRNSDRVGLILFTDQVELYVPPKKGVRHVLRIIRDALSHPPAHRGTRLCPALDFLNRVSRRRSVSFVISDFRAPADYERELGATARRHDVIGVIVNDRRERDLPAVGLVEWQDAETGRRFLADTSDRRTRQTLQTLQDRRRDELAACLRRSGVEHLDVFTGEAYEKEFVRFFRNREKRRRR